MPERVTTDDLVRSAAELLDQAGRDGRRRILGIAGPPGAGKSTLAEAVVGALGVGSVVVAQDGFHLAQRVLDATGRADRKGAPDTFDDAGFAALLQRVRGQDPHGVEVVYAPEFRRDLEEPVGSAVPIHPGAGLVVVEGNYLLLDEGAWPRARACLDAVWFLAPPAARRRDALVRRHESFGRSPVAAREWVDRSDEANARLVDATAVRADRVVDVWNADETQRW